MRLAARWKRCVRVWGHCRGGGGSGGRGSRVVAVGNMNVRAEPWYNNRRGGGVGRKISWSEASNVAGFHGREISWGNIIWGEPSTARVGIAGGESGECDYAGVGLQAGITCGVSGDAGERARIAGRGAWRASPKKGGHPLYHHIE